MSVRRIGKDTTSVDALSWNGNGFTDPVAHELWLQLPPQLHTAARAEIVASNAPFHILRNDTRRIVLLAFSDPPRTAAPSGVVVHRQHAYGNYCYDDTFCTYEDPATGCFLAFMRPAEPAT